MSNAHLHEIYSMNPDAALKLWLETFGLTEREMFSIPRGLLMHTVPTIDDVVLVIDPQFCGAENIEQFAEKFDEYQERVMSGHCYGRHTLMVAAELADNRYKSRDEIRRRVAIEILRRTPPKNWGHYSRECSEELGLETLHYHKFYEMWRLL